jgi:hypothetical protein
MDERPTCGEGLAQNSALPAKLGEVIAGVAGVLETHLKPLDLKDENAKSEHDAYLTLAKDHRKIAAELQATAKRMVEYRDLPMGRHDPKVMSSPKALEAFEQFVAREGELLGLLQARLTQDRTMLVAMGGASGGD